MVITKAFMEDRVGFEDYLRAKKIDSAAFSRAEPNVWSAWKREFEQVHPNSFTMQKLNLINAIRRKYLQVELKASSAVEPEQVQPPKPGPPRPVIKPKPKME